MKFCQHCGLEREEDSPHENLCKKCWKFDVWAQGKLVDSKTGRDLSK